MELLEINRLVTKLRADVMGLCRMAAALVLAGGLILALPGEGAADSSLSPLTVLRQKDQLAVSTRLDGEFFSTVEEAIASGIPTTFSYEVEIWLKNRLWSDKTIVSKAVERVVKFNSLTNEYQVVQKSDSTTWDRTSKNLGEVRKWLTELDALPLVKLSELDPEKTYYVRARATVKTEQSKPALKYMLFLFPRSTTKTAWEQSEPFLLKELKAFTARTPIPVPSAANP